MVTTVLAGSDPTEEVLEVPSTPVLMVFNKMVSFAILNVMMDTTVLAQSAGKDAQTSSEMMVLSATSLIHMAEVLDMLSGVKAPATMITLKDVRSGDLCGTQDVTTTSTTSHAASAHLTAHLA